MLSLYHRTLEECDPRRLIRSAVPRDCPRYVVAIGKCAGPLLDGFPHPVDRAAAFFPRGYPAPRRAHEASLGGHPDLTPESFDAGAALLEFVEKHDDITFLISGGGSACVEWPLEPWFTRDELREVNHRLLESGSTIRDINTVRKHLSSIKGGRLAERIRNDHCTFVYSDVATGALADVASGPTLPDPSTKDDAANILERVGGCDAIVERLRDHSLPDTSKTLAASAFLIADNNTLTLTAARLCRQMGLAAEVWEGQIESPVQEAAEALVERASSLSNGTVLVAGGETTVVKRGDGQGGRCCELAVRFAVAAHERGLRNLEALFASSDGVDGNSGCAGVHLPTISTVADRDSIDADLRRSDSLSAAKKIGVPIVMRATGNNLRDLFLIHST